MTAFNPPSILFFNGVTFNPEIIEQGSTVSGGGGDVTLAGNNNFTGANSFTGGSINVTTQGNGTSTTLAASTLFVSNAITALRAASNFWSSVNSYANGIRASNIDTYNTNSTLFIGQTRASGLQIGNNIITTKVFTAQATPFRATYIDSGSTVEDLYIGYNTTKTIIGSSGKTLSIDSNIEMYTGLTISQILGEPTFTSTITDRIVFGNTFNVFNGEIIVGNEIKLSNNGNLSIGSTNKIEFTTEYGINQLFLSGNGGVNGYVLQSGGPGGTLSWVAPSGGVSLAGNNSWTGTNDFTNITAPTLTYPDNTTNVATTAYVDGAIASVGGVSLAANNTFTGSNTFTGLTTTSGSIETDLIDSINGVITINGTIHLSKNTTGINPTFIGTSSTSALNLIEFHSNSNFVTAYDSRILAYGGTAFDGAGILQLEADTITLTSNSLSIDSISSFNYPATFNSGLTSSGIYCNTYDSFVSGAPMNLGNSFATSVEIARTGIATNVLAALNVTGITTATGGFRTDLIDRITSGILSIGSNALTTGVTISKALIASLTLEVTGLLTATAGLRTNLIDRITSGVLSIGSNALTTGVTISKALIASLTLEVTGLLTATAGLRTNLIDRITSGSLVIGSNALTTAVSIQKSLILTDPLILGSVATASTELGYTESITIAAATLAAVITGTETTILTISSLPAGIWSISYALKASGATGTATVTRFYTFINPSTSVIANVGPIAPSGGADSYSLGTGNSDASVNNNGSIIVKTTSATTFVLRYFMTSTAAVNFRQTGCYLTATRLG